MEAYLREFGMTISRFLAVSLGAGIVVLATQVAWQYLTGTSVPVAVWLVLALCYVADIVETALKVVNKDSAALDKG